MPSPMRCGKTAEPRAHLRPAGVLARGAAQAKGSSASTAKARLLLRCHAQAVETSGKLGGTDTLARASVAPEGTGGTAGTPAVHANTPAGVQPLETSGIITCEAASGLAEAVSVLQQEVAKAAASQLRLAPSGLLRIEVPVAGSESPLEWLMKLSAAGSEEEGGGTPYPRAFMSMRRSSAPGTPGTAKAEEVAARMGPVAGVGAAWSWTGEQGQQLDHAAMDSMQRLLSATSHQRVRVLGGGRFDHERPAGAEWEAFGAYRFFLPLLELGEHAGQLYLACSMSWERPPPGEKRRNDGNPSSLQESAERAQAALARAAAAGQGGHTLAAAQAHLLEEQQTPARSEWEEVMAEVLGQINGKGGAAASATEEAGAAGEHGLSGMDPDLLLQEFLQNGQEGLDGLLAGLHSAAPPKKRPEGAAPTAAGGDAQAPLTKVVLARRTSALLQGRLQPLQLLALLQQRDPRAYHIFFQVDPHHAFVACTPERLYVRSGLLVGSEAVAGTRPRGSPGSMEEDFWLGLQLLQSDKDHREFMMVRNWVEAALQQVSEEVEVEVPKSLLKQQAVQHLYGRLCARLQPTTTDAHLLAALHPTPAVCGRPRQQTQQLLRQLEGFDRGFYAGPFGWLAPGASEFAVGIRSALMAPPHDSAAAAATALHMYAGVGVVLGSEVEAEWRELDLKVRQFRRLLQPRLPLEQAANINVVAARLIVEELARCGLTTFCVAPGSRSTPLTAAAAAHPAAQVVVGIDERSLAFWAQGHSRATGKPAVVITTSGTAVANLLPAVVEASQSNVPLLLLTADRPADMRDSGANQTIRQDHIFGGYVRWFHDLLPPQPGMSGRALLTTVDAAVRQAMQEPAGPVHLNCQFREPLAPTPEPWDGGRVLQGLARWQASDLPFTAAPAGAPPPAAGLPGAALEVAAALRSAESGLLVVGELTRPEDRLAALRLARALRWPVAADILSGLRLGHLAQQQGAMLVHHIDHLLLDRASWPLLRPQVVLQVGVHLTSKRLWQWLEWCASSDELGAADPTRWVYCSAAPQRQDQCHAHSDFLQLPPAQLAAALRPPAAQPRSAWYGELLQELDGVVDRALDARLADGGAERLSEPLVARMVATQLPAGAALFAGNSMPIRDLDMFARPLQRSPPRAAARPAQSLPAETYLSSSAHASDGCAAGGCGGLPPNAYDLASGSKAVSTAAPPRLSGEGAGTRPAAETAETHAAGGGAEPGPVCVPVAANRGASGIDGVLSSAAGFAQGLGRVTTLLLGDLSFLHDSNGLGLLRSREAAPPLVVVLVNNAGGGIFSFLPVADAVEEETFSQLWATPQHADLEGLCRAHGVPHQRVSEPEQLQAALHSAWSLGRHNVVEVVTNRSSNLAFHRSLQQAVAAQLRRVLPAMVPAAALLPRGMAAEAAAWSMERRLTQCDVCAAPKIVHVSWHKHSLPMQQSLTTSADGADSRHGLLLRICLMAGPQLSWGVGEASPLPGLHAESLEEVQVQLAALPCLLHNATAPLHLAVPCLTERAGPWPQASLLAWLRSAVGVDPDSLLPSVRFALDSALLSALSKLLAGGASGDRESGAAACSAQLLAALLPEAAFVSSDPAAAVGVNGLLDPRQEPPDAVAERAGLMVDDGCRCIKVKVGRRDSPRSCAEVVNAVRQRVGPDVALRADANRKWSLKDALEFARFLSPLANLEYIEEPTRDPRDLTQFHAITHIAVALDETVDELHRDSRLLPHLQGGSDPVRGAATGDDDDCGVLSGVPSDSSEGLAAVVLKPSLLGGVWDTMSAVRAACRRGIRPIISSSFEAAPGIAFLAHIAAAADLLWNECVAERKASRADPLRSRVEAIPDASGSSGSRITFHGLGTLTWFQQQGSALADPLRAGKGRSSSISLPEAARRIEAVASAAPQLPAPDLPMAGFSQRQLRARTSRGEYRCHVLHAAPEQQGKAAVLLLHGFLGGADDWAPVMRALAAAGHECAAVDLPGHGGTVLPGGCEKPGNGSSSWAPSVDMEEMADVVEAAVDALGWSRCALVGYSMGARIALHSLVRQERSGGSGRRRFLAGAIVSGTAGLPEAAQREARAARDARQAAFLASAGVAAFVDSWYRAPLWDSLRRHPAFPAVRARRAGADSPAAAAQLAAVLEGCSTGRQRSLWGELPGISVPVLFAAGAADSKFRGILHRMAARVAERCVAGEPAAVARGSDAARSGVSTFRAAGAGGRRTGWEELPEGGGVAVYSEVPGAGHAVHLEQPLALAGHLLAFLSTAGP